MNTKTTFWIAIAILFIATLFLTFKTGSTSTEVQSVQAAITAAKANAASYGGMVGGC